MGLPKVILVATDFSEDAKKAVAEAVQLAKVLDARLYLMHAWQVPTTSWEGGWAMPQDVFVQVEANARTALQDAVDAVRPQYPSVQDMFVQGDPREAILSTANTVHADLIVLGTHGRRGVSRLLLGSVAESVVRHATCSVLISREGA
jgi:nucleotide-binding universal stress UspA family protein